MTMPVPARTLVGVSLFLLFVLPAPTSADNEPPIPTSVWLYTTIIDSSDPSSFGGVEYVGTARRQFYDFGSRTWPTLNVYLFTARLGNRWTEFQVHEEFGSREAAREQVDRYGPILGRLPRVLLENAIEVEISRPATTHPLDEVDPVAQGGLGGIFHIYTDEAEKVVRNGYMEEVLLHEGGHVSLDRHHANAPGWLDAQRADGGFLTPYAQQHPLGEDVAESFWGWFIVNYRPERVSRAHHDAILEAIPNRLAYFDRQNFDMTPYVRVAPVSALPLVGLLLLAGLLVVAGRRRIV